MENFDLSKLKALAYERLNVVQMIWYIFESLENIALGRLNVTQIIDISLKVWKTLWKQEQMLVTSIFSCSHDVYKRFLFYGLV